MLLAREGFLMTWQFKFGDVSAMLAITISAPRLPPIKEGRTREP